MYIDSMLQRPPKVSPKKEKNRTGVPGPVLQSFFAKKNTFFFLAWLANIDMSL